jgi:glycosyltransferase 2 family protein
LSIYSSWAARLAVSAVVLAVLFALLPVRQLAAAVSSAPPALWGIALLVFLAGHVAAAFKWQLLLRHHRQIPAAHWLRAHFAGLAANLCLPGVAGGDVVRAEFIRRSHGHGEQVAVAAIVDRALDCAALLALASVGVLLSPGAQTPRGTVVVIAAAALTGATAAVLLTVALSKSRWRHLGVVQRLANAAAVLAARPALPLACFVLSLGVQTMFVLLNMRLGAAVGVDVPLAAWFVAWPLAKLVALVPVSLAGLGVREAALVVFLRPYAAAPALVTAAGLLWQSVLFAGGLIGWLAGAAIPTRASAPQAGKPVEL